MAGNIPAGSMSTEIKLNGSQSVHTLRELKQAVTQATSAWKAQRAELSSIGKSTQAAETKYRGLAETVKKQKDYISGLQSEQRHLEEAQKSVDRSTREGQQEYGKYNEALQKNETRIHSAETRLTSLTNQQSKARKSLDYYKSGLADAQKSLKQNEAVTKSYVARLASEGKNYESAKAKLSGYKNSIQNLTKQQKIQENELSKIASESGKSSDAYKKQQIRVNETATSIAKLNSKVKTTQSDVNRLNPHGFNKIANGAKHVTDAADKMKAGLKGAWDHIKTGATAAAAGIGAVGVAAVSGAKKAGSLQQSYREITNLAVTGGEKQREAVKNVTEMQRQGRDMSIKYGKSQQSIAEAYEDLVKRGYTTKQALGAMRSELQASVASGDDFQDVVHVSSTTLEGFGMRAKTTAQMTANTKRAVNELAYAADMTSTGFKDLGYGMSYVAASAHSAGFSLSETASAMGILSNNGLEASKAGTGLNRVINQLSNAAEGLKKGAKNNVLAQLGIKPKEIMNSKGQLRSLATVFGVLNKHMKGMSKIQKINIMKNLFGTTGEQAGLILAKYNKQLDSLSKKTLKAGKDGDYVAKLSAKNSQTAQMQMARLKQAGNAFQITLGKRMLPAITEAGDQLVVFLNKSKDGKALTRDFANGVGALSHALVGMIEWIAKHKQETKWIAGGLGAAFGIVKLAQFVQWLNDTRLAMVGLKDSSKVLSGLSKGFKGVEDISKLSGTEKVFAHIGKGINDLVHPIKTAQSLIGKFKTTKLYDLGGKIGHAISKGFGKSVDFAHSLASKISDAAHALASKASDLGHRIGNAISKGIKATTKFSMGKRLATGAIAGAAVATPEVINAVKNRHSATNRSKDIGGAVGAIAGGTLTSMIPVVGPLLAPVGAVIGKYAGRWGGQAVDSFTKGWQKNKPPKKFWSLENLGWSMHNMAKQTNAGFNSWAKSLKRGFNNAKKGFNNFHKSVNRNISNFVRAARKKYNQIATAPAKAFKKGWNEAYKHSSKGTKQIMRSTENFAKNYVKIHQKANRETIKNFASFGKRLKKNHGDLFKTIGQTAKTQLKIEEQKWSSSWKNIRSFTTGVWRGINLNAHSFYNSLNKSTHGGLGKVFSAFESFGKGIASFWRGLWKGIENFFNGIWHGIIDQIKDVRKVLSHIHIGSLHLASGTDWRKRYGVPAVVNDAPGSDYREGLLDHGNLIPFPAKRNLPFWLLPGQDVVNGHDMANMFDRAIHYANGTVDLRASGYQISKKDLLPNVVSLLKSNIQITKARNKKYDLLLEDYKEHRDKLDRRRDRKDKNYLSDKQRREKAEKASRADSAKIAKLSSALIVAVKDGHKKEAEKLANEISKLKANRTKENKIASTSIRDLQANTSKRKAAAKQVAKDKAELKKLGDEISKAMKRHDTSEAKKLTTRFNAISKDLTREKSLAKKPNPHQGKTLVDEGLLLGTNRRIGHSEWISTALFKKLTTAPKTKKKSKKRKTRKRKTRRRRTTEISSRSLSSIRKLLNSRATKSRSSETLRSLRRLLGERTTRRRRSTSTTRRRTTTRRRSSTRSISLSGLTRSASSVRASATGAKTIKALAKSIKAIKSKHVKVSVKASGSKALKSLAKYVKRIKSSKHRVTVKTKGTKALKALHKAVKAIKGSTHYVRVKTSGVKQLKELQKNITEVHKRVDSLTKALKKDTFGKDIAKQAEEAVKSLKGNGNFTKVISKMTKDSTKDFKSMVKSINKDADSMAKTTKGDYSKMHKNILASMKSIYSGVNRFAKQTANAFNNALHKMIGYAKNDMQSTIRQINRSIRGINTVLVQFGGNKSVIKYAHFAKGTDANGRLTHDTWAVVNDATSGPKQEAVVTDKNDIILPKGNNQPMLLKKGWGVLNGTQTESLSLPHFAKGSGLSHSALRKLAKRSLEHFARAFEQMFTNHVNSQGQDVQKDFTNLSKSAGTHYGNPWSQAIWTVINNAIGDAGLGGTREAFLKYAERVFSGVPYQLGAASKRLSDCSGMVMQALRHFHIYIGRDTVSMADSSGTEYLGKSLSKTVPGDLVIFGHGTGAAGHVGIIKNPAKGTMFNETQPYAHVSKISDDTGMGYGFYRIKGLHNASKKHGKGKEPSKDLLSLARHELGAKAIKWIKDHLGEETGLIGAFKLTGDVGDRARAIARALKKAVPGATKSGLAAVIGSWLFESGSLNPSAVNPDGGASGFGQWLGIRKTRLIAYAKRHGKSWRNPALQLSFALHGDTGMTGIFRRILTGHGSPSSLANAFSNEWEKGGYNAQHAAGAESVYRMLKHFANGGIATTPSIFGEAGPEMAVPLIPSKSTRAWELIGKAVAILSQQSGLNAQQNQLNSKEQKEEHDFRQAVLLLLRELLAKSNVADIKLTTPAGRALWEVVQPFEKEDLRAIQIKLRRRLSAR